MKTIWKTKRIEWVAMALCAFSLTICASASPGDFYPSYEARVVAHLTKLGTPVRQMFLQQEGRKAYLYVRTDSQPGYTVFDVTKPEHPRVVYRRPENLTVLESGLAISEIPDDSKTGNPAQAPNRTGSPTIRAPESVRLLDVSDPAHPRTVQMFDGVTSIVRDDARNLIYLANADGIWILSHNQVLRRHLCSSSDAISSAIPNCD